MMVLQYLRGIRSIADYPRRIKQKAGGNLASDEDGKNSRTYSGESLNEGFDGPTN
jgi:hypothetical protein